ncbi:MAG: enolase C-terminal domain-like protein [Anaerolineae bacterium]
MAHDLSWYLGKDYQGLYPSQFLRPKYAERVPIFHLVGGLDKLTRAELDDSDPNDGLPNCLQDWIERDGLYCLKVKLRGNDLDWDVERLLAVDAIAAKVLAKQGRDTWCLSADTNEVCASPDYIIEMMARVKAESASAYKRVLYIEQPTARDLRAAPHDMHALAKVVPVLADESLYDDEMFDLAIALGWSGPALKACKGQSHTILWLAKAAKLGLPYSIQDLTNPGLALLQSVGLAARSYPIMGVEYNSRQYFPWLSPQVRRAHPQAFTVVDGEVSTASLRGPGLGFRMAEIQSQEALPPGFQESNR